MIVDNERRRVSREELERQGQAISFYVLVDASDPERVLLYHATLPALAWVTQTVRLEGEGAVPAAVIGDAVVPLTEDERREWDELAASGAEPVRAMDYEELAGTEDTVELEELGVADPERTPYRPTSWRYLPLVFDDVEIGPDDVFIDYGCGKGRMLLEAAARPFARVLGVELAPQLADIARENVEHNRDRLRCPTVEVLVADAANYELPDDVTVVYLHNPFLGSTFDRVLEKITASLDRRPRDLTLIYLLPREERSIDASGRFELVRRRRFGPGGNQILYYRSKALSPELATAAPATQRNFASGRPANWSEQVIGVDASGSVLQTTAGDLEIPDQPEPDRETVEIEFDDEMHSFLSRLCIWIDFRGRRSIPPTSVEPPVHIRTVGGPSHKIGAFSLYGFNGVSSIGRYCSTANDLICAHIEHPTDWLSTSTFVYDRDAPGVLWRPFRESNLGQREGEGFVPQPRDHSRSREVHIGNDVYVGAGVYIYGGVTIGDGAIIGTGSVVAKDVPPFGVVLGHPARLVRYRLPEPLIERVMNVRWWQYAFTDLGGLDVRNVEETLDGIEERAAAGTIAPYRPRWISFGWLKSTADLLRE